MINFVISITLVRTIAWSVWQRGVIIPCEKAEISLRRTRKAPKRRKPVKTTDLAEIIVRSLEFVARLAEI